MAAESVNSAGGPRTQISTESGVGRGRGASRMQQIPLRGWWDIAARVWANLGRDNVSLISAGLAMYALLSVFPAITATVSIYGLFLTPAHMVTQMSAFSGAMPSGVWSIFQSQLLDVASRQHGTLTSAAVIGVLIALWSARAGMSSLMTATNIAYGEHEKRGLFTQIGLSLIFTVASVVGFALMLILSLAVPVILDVLGTSPWVQATAAAARWALLWCFAVLGLAVIYRFAPARRPARWHWVTLGSVIAATLWLLGSVLFAFYVRTFGSYQRSYGALGSMVVLLLWFYLSSFFLVLGAEINAETERQTTLDTTTGPSAPMGRRGAFAADTVGRASGPGDGPGR